MTSMSECDYCHPEDFCTLGKGECGFQGEMMRCTAKPEDLVTICEDCGKPEDECECMEW